MRPPGFSLCCCADTGRFGAFSDAPSSTIKSHHSITLAAAFLSIVAARGEAAESSYQQPPLFRAGDTLMDPARFQALMMTSRIIGDSDYLFIESGGSSDRA